MSANLDKAPFVKGEALQKLIEIIAGVKKGSDLRDDEIIKLFETDEFTLVTYTELKSLIADSKLEPGHKYAITDYAGGQIAVQAVSNSKISESALYGDFAICSVALNDEPSIIYFADVKGNKFNFDPFVEIPAYSTTTFVDNEIIWPYRAGVPTKPEGWSINVTSGAKNNKIYGKVNIDCAVLAWNNIENQATATLKGATISNNTIKAGATVNLQGTGDIQNNDFGANCSVVGTSLQMCDTNKIADGCQDIKFETAVAGTIMDANCQNIKLKMAMRNKFGMQCANIALNGTNQISGNVFGMCVGLNDGAQTTGTYTVTLADMACQNIIGDYCYDTTIDAYTIGCILDGYNRVRISGGSAQKYMQGYHVKAMVGYAPQLSRPTVSPYKGYIEQGFRVNVGVDTNGQLIYWTDDESNVDLSNYATKTYVTEEIAKIEIPDAPTDTFTGSNKVTTVVDVPVTKSTVLAEISASETVSFTSGLPEGKEVYMIVKNTGSEAITLTLPAGANVESLSIDASKTAEVSVINIAGEYFVRAAQDVVLSGGTCNCPEIAEITAADVEAAFNA